MFVTGLVLQRLLVCDVLRKIIKDLLGRDSRSDSDTVYCVHDCVRYTTGRHDGHTSSVLELETMLETCSLGLLRFRNSRTSLHTQRSTCPEFC